MKKTFIIAAVIIALVLIIFFSARSGKGAEGEEIYAETVEPRNIVSVVSASGEIQPKKQVKISSDVIGKIERLYVDEGDKVAKGDILLQLDPDLYQSDVNRLKAALNMTAIDVENKKLALERARQKLERNDDLFEKELISRDLRDDIKLQYDTAEIALEAAGEGVRQARASLKRAEESLEDTTIVSPLEGTVTALNAEEGETVMTGTMNNPGTVIMVISDMDTVTARLEVDESYITRVELHQKAAVDVDAVEDREYEGKVTEIGSSVRPSQERVSVFEVEITLEDPDDNLVPGMSADGNIETGRRDDVLAVPIQAVLEKEDEEGESGRAVFTAEDGKAVLRYVETGISDDTHIVVTEGLSEGEKVITGPYRTLRDLKEGDKIQFKEAMDFKKEETEKKENISVEVG